MISSRAVLATTAINAEEIVRGLRPNEAAAAQALFNGLRVLPVRREDAELAGTWAGSTLPGESPCIKRTA